MALQLLKCPQCSAPLTPSGRFARSVVCAFCGATVQLDGSVSVARFREALRSWNSPSEQGYSTWLTLEGAHWAPGPLVARGELSDVYVADRARRPTERVLLKILRDPEDGPLFIREWEVLQQLRQAEALGSFASRMPEPVAQGVVSQGPHEGRRAMAFRWASSFRHTLESVRRVHPQGVDPRVGVWVWRRILEVLTFLHRDGFVHGAIVPPHLMVEDGEHGLRLVGFCCADRAGLPLRAVNERYGAFYPDALRRSGRLSPSSDVQMSARCVAWLLGGEAATGEVPDVIPRPFRALLEAVSGGEARDAWALREQLGQVARAAFGPPSFNPLTLPG